jgi:3-oxoacyl-[acyl-carrier protein] reductase
MSTGAINVLSRTLAKQLGPRGIIVNSVAVGVVDTDMGGLVDSAPGIREGIAATVALGRIGRPADVADVVAFLASDEGRLDHRPHPRRK